MDLANAFLYGELEKLVYMEQPSLFEEKSPDFVWKLKTAIYGLKMTPLIWNKTFDDFMVG